MKMNRHQRRAAEAQKHDETFVHGRVAGCPICASANGDTVFVMRVRSTDEQTYFDYLGATNRLCPECREAEAYSQLKSAEIHAKAAEWNKEVRASPQFRGCPCCSWGVEWEPCERPSWLTMN
jgi:hypothetical protein